MRDQNPLEGGAPCVGMHEDLWHLCVWCTDRAPRPWGWPCLLRRRGPQCSSAWTLPSHGSGGEACTPSVCIPSNPGGWGKADTLPGYLLSALLGCVPKAVTPLRGTPGSVPTQQLETKPHVVLSLSTGPEFPVGTSGAPFLPFVHRGTTFPAWGPVLPRTPRNGLWPHTERKLIGFVFHLVVFHP